MMVYIVLAYHDYYPSGDNTRGVFHNREDAQELVKELKGSGNFDHVEVEAYGVQ